MKRKTERIRLAKKEGWHTGHNKKEPQVLYDLTTEIELCLAYDAGWVEGSEAPDDAINPYGVYHSNRVPKSGWYKHENASKVHFYYKGCTSSACGMARFDAERCTLIAAEKCKVCCRN